MWTIFGRASYHKYFQQNSSVIFLLLVFCWLKSKRINNFCFNFTDYPNVQTNEIRVAQKFFRFQLFFLTKKNEVDKRQSKKWIATNWSWQENNNEITKHSKKKKKVTHIFIFTILIFELFLVFKTSTYIYLCIQTYIYVFMHE